MIQLTKQLGHLDHQNHPFLVGTLKCSKVLVHGPPAAMGWLNISGDNLQFFRSRASTSEYEQLPINCRLFQNTVNLQDKCLFSKKTEIRN